VGKVISYPTTRPAVVGSSTLTRRCGPAKICLVAFDLILRSIMFRTASSVIAGRICVWLAAAMLAFPFVPTSPCHCLSEGPIEPCCSARLHHEEAPTINRGCCALPKQRVTPSCCAKTDPTAIPNDTKSCHCGPTCKCHLSRHSDPQPAVPTAPIRNGTEQVQWVTLTHAATMAIVAEADTPLVAEPSGDPLFETALDRCITLSRFLC